VSGPALTAYNNAGATRGDQVATCDIFWCDIQSLTSLPIGTRIFDIETEETADAFEALADAFGTIGNQSPQATPTAIALPENLYNDPQGWSSSLIQQIDNISEYLETGDYYGMAESFGFVNVGQGNSFYSYLQEDPGDPDYNPYGFNIHQDPQLFGPQGITPESASPLAYAGNDFWEVFGSYQASYPQAIPLIPSFDVSMTDNDIYGSPRNAYDSEVIGAVDFPSDYFWGMNGCGRCSTGRYCRD